MFQQHCLIVGLGNPGQRYEMTRHNLGFMVVKRLAEVFAVTFTKETRFSAWAAKAKVGSLTVHLLMPATYMNESGRAVRRYCNYYKLVSDDLLVVSDDVSLPFGALRLRSSGSAGGHNGLKSIEKEVGTREYLRLRMGISCSQQGSELADFVLGRFTHSEMKELAFFVERGTDTAKRLLTEEVKRVMNDVNTRK